MKKDVTIPPHEQQLARPGHLSPRCLVVLVFTSCSPFPPHEQLLTAAVGGAVVEVAAIGVGVAPCEQALAAVCCLMSSLVHGSCDVAGGAYLLGSPRHSHSVVPLFLLTCHPHCRL